MDGSRPGRRKRDPLYRIRKLLLTGSERLDEPGRDRMLLGQHVGDPTTRYSPRGSPKESVRDVYLAERWREARTLLDRTIAGCLTDDVPEIVSLGKTLQSWRSEILAHHTTGGTTDTSNGPTEGLNLCVKWVKRCAHGMRSLLALPAPRPPPRRWRHLASTLPTAASARATHTRRAPKPATTTRHDLCVGRERTRR
jgi:Transposase